MNIIIELIPVIMKRRNFLTYSSLASTAMLMPNFLQAFSSPKTYNSRSGKKLIVIQFSGGNDGLNTIIPYRNDVYYSSRPSLSIPKNEALRATDELAFNPNMQALRDLYEEGLVSIVNSVGYPNPIRSHFRSMDIWHTASGSENYWQTGWLGRYLDNNCAGCIHQAIELDESLGLALKGDVRSGFAMDNVRQLKRTSSNRFLKNLAQQQHEHEHETVAYLYKTMIETQQSADYLFEHSKVYESKLEYPNGAFGRDLKQVAELITADTDTRIYYVNLGGFDTHANQKNAQGRLLKQFSDGVGALVKDLKQNNLLDDVLIMAFSEFGRRVKQNASNGTDHGTANNVFLIGNQLKKNGFYNAAPNLLDLDKGDLKYEIDFRRIYATLLDDWLEADASNILNGRFDKLSLL